MRQKLFSACRQLAARLCKSFAVGRPSRRLPGPHEAAATMRLALLLALAAPGAAITAPKQALPPTSEKLSKRGGSVKQLPITNWLPGLSKSDVLNDALAGLTVAAMLIPQGMSYAVHKSNRRGASPPRLDHDLHAIDATSARWRGVVVYYAPDSLVDLRTGPTPRSLG